MAKKESQPAEKPAKKKRSPLVLIAGLLVGLIVIGGGGFMAYIAIFPDVDSTSKCNFEGRKER